MIYKRWAINFFFEEGGGIRTVRIFLYSSVQSYLNGRYLFEITTIA